MPAEVVPWLVLALAVFGGAAWLFRTVREDLRLGRDEARGAAAELRGEVAARFAESAIALAATLQGVTSQIKELQEGNEKKLDQMRQVVDEKLQGTLEKRLGESFKLVSAQLEAVHKGLGDMQNLATGVGDLKRVLSNVKTRGTFGEVQLGAILEQVLTPDQYARNVRPRPDSGETVEFAVRLP
ncbi:MAG: DNA recombination protein RmuC, partial [Myxococcota bacterium]